MDDSCTRYFSTCFRLSRSALKRNQKELMGTNGNIHVYVDHWREAVSCCCQWRYAADIDHILQDKTCKQVVIPLMSCILYLHILPHTNTESHTLYVLFSMSTTETLQAGNDTKAWGNIMSNYPGKYSQLWAYVHKTCHTVNLCLFLLVPCPV